MRQAETAKRVYHEDIEPTLHPRQVFVRTHLEQFIREYGQEPTALELVRYIGAQHPDHRLIDVNTVRPRLTEMEEQGYVEHADKRPCSVSNKRVFTWRPSTPKPPRLAEPEPQRLNF